MGITSSDGVAIIGTGTIGSAVAFRLLDSGRKVIVWNRSGGRAAALRESGAVAVASPAAAASAADVVIIAVADGPAFLAVAGGDDGLLSGLREGSLVINLATVPPGTIRGLEKDTIARRARLIDCGVLGNARMARAGQLRLYVGASESDLAKARPLLDLIGVSSQHVGAVGSGMVMKIALNLVLGVELAAMAEAIELASRLGLEPAIVADAIGSSGVASPVMGFRAPRMGGRRYEQPDFRLSLMHKDLALARQVASAAGATLPTTEAALHLNERALRRGLAELDAAAVLEVLGSSALE